ncbi:hypothetical protein B0H14DRAFT_2609985 [Mycena olivaceomarginata]|nr:hypothetical protein B0H14DRAFT_2609985 [Mycena olivaceomarginata]
MCIVLVSYGFNCRRISWGYRLIVTGRKQRFPAHNCLLSGAAGYVRVLVIILTTRIEPDKETTTSSPSFRERRAPPFGSGGVRARARDHLDHADRARQGAAIIFYRDGSNCEAMASFARLASPFAGRESPPPPVVLLLSQTDLHMPSSPGLLIHQDLGLAPSSKLKKNVAFAPVHTYPPPPILAATDLIPCPPQLSRHLLEHHPGWEVDTAQTLVIKFQKTIYKLVDKILDTSQSLKYQDPELVAKVYKQAIQMHPILRNYEDNWATKCVIGAHLKTTAQNAVKEAETAKKALTTMKDFLDTGRRTRSRRTQPEVQNNCTI